MGDDGRMHAQREGSHVPAHPHRRVTSFRNRHSALSDAQQRTWDRRWPELGRTTRNDDDEPAGLLDTTAWFGRSAPLVLEIGCGAGISTAAMAFDEPLVDVIAVEVYRRGLGQLISAIDRDDLRNVRLIRGDGVEVLENMLAPASLTGVRIFFPDPWPKARHHKRRLIQPETVALIADRLKPGGVFHAATDHADYAEQIGEVGDAEPRLRRIPFETSGLPISVRRPTTKFEEKGIRVGSAINEFVWIKRRTDSHADTADTDWRRS